MHEDQLIRDDIDTFLKKQQYKELLRFVTIGSVDDGKSTLIGRLLHDSVGIFEDLLQDVAGDDTGDIDLARITDGLQAEREQGITIDVAYRFFSTPARKFILADTPGHVQYTRNMATGSSTADVAIILIDARLGVLEQSRRHAYITSLLGIRKLAVCVNKMDLVDFDRAVYDDITKDFSQVADKLGFQDVRLFPISALRGDNVVKRSERTPWYEGPPVLEYLETVPVGEEEVAAFRFPVQSAIRPNLDYRGFAGQIGTGTVKKGDPIMVLPSGKMSTVAGIDLFDKELEEAGPPLSVTIRLSDEIDVSRGDMLADPSDPPTVGRHVEAMVIWMTERPMDPGRSYLVKHTTQFTRAFVDEVVCGIDLHTLQEKPIDTLGLNDIGKLKLTTNRALIFDAYGANRTTGAFIIVDSVTNETVGAGMITGASRSSAQTGQATEVSAAERVERLRQQGEVVWVVAKEQEKADAFAYALERQLFDLGYLPVVARDAHDALAKAGLVVLVPATSAPGGMILEIRDDADQDDRESVAEQLVSTLREKSILR